MTSALRLHVEPALAGSPLVLAFEGWNDAGEAATCAARYLDTAIASVPLAEIDGESFYDFTVRRPMMKLDEDDARVVEWPDTRFRYGSIDGSRELVLGIGVEPHLRWRTYCDCLIEVVRALALRPVVLLGAYMADVVYSRPVGVSGYASRPGLLEGIDVAPSGYEGPTGIVGVLADRLRREGVEVVSLWAGLPHYINATPNPRGALALVHKVTACLDMRLDEEPLRRQAAAFEQKVSALVASDPELGEYVRQLKKRDFAQ